MKPCFVSPILARAAEELGVEILIEPRYGYVVRIKKGEGEYRYSRNTVFDLNGAGATKIARDKDYATFFLKQLGYPVPEGDSFHSDKWAKAIKSDRTKEKAWEYAQQLGLPVIVKPNSKSQGSGVTKVWNKQEFDQAVKAISKIDHVFLVQKLIHARDYRIVVLDHEIISAYERLPLSVMGDGKSNIKQLLKQKQEGFKAIRRNTTINIKDPRLVTELAHQSLRLDSVPEKDQKVQLLSNANLSNGGDAIDVTQEVHIAWKALAVKIAKEMNLRYTGIDVLLPSGTLSEPPSDYIVLEINAAPGLDNYAAIGDKQKTIVKDMYKKIILAM